MTIGVDHTCGPGVSYCGARQCSTSDFVGPQRDYATACPVRAMMVAKASDGTRRASEGGLLSADAKKSRRLGARGGGTETYSFGQQRPDGRAISLGTPSPWAVTLFSLVTGGWWLNQRRFT